MKEYTIDELVTVAKRENNLKRPYLYVNPIQGKHIPVTPHKVLNLFKYMGDILQEKYPYEQILVIGFAETATAVGAGISRFANNVRWCKLPEKNMKMQNICILRNPTVMLLSKV